MARNSNESQRDSYTRQLEIDSAVEEHASLQPSSINLRNKLAIHQQTMEVKRLLSYAEPAQAELTQDVPLSDTGYEPNWDYYRYLETAQPGDADWDHYTYLGDENAAALALGSFDSKDEQKTDAYQLQKRATAAAKAGKWRSYREKKRTQNAQSEAWVAGYEAIGEDWRNLFNNLPKNGEVTQNGDSQLEGNLPFSPVRVHPFTRSLGQLPLKNGATSVRTHLVHPPVRVVV